MRISLALFVAASLALAGRAGAQEEGGLDALLQDLNTDATTTVAPAPSNDVAVEASDPVAVAPVSEEASASVEAVDPVVADPAVVEEVAPVADAPVMDVPAEVVAPTVDVAVEPEPVPVVEAVAPEAVAPQADASAEAITEVTEGSNPALFAQQEEVRRQARETEGRKNLELGLTALQAGRLDEAIDKLKDAQAKIPSRPATEGLVKQARTSLGQAYSRKAKEAFDKGDLKTARQSMNQSKAFAATESLESMDRKLTRAEERAAVEATKPIPVKKRADIVEREKSIKELLAEGRQYLEAGDYNAAEVLFEKVLIKDEYNIDAMRFLRKLDELRYVARSKEREATEADVIQRVRDSWNPPVRQETQLPQSAQNRGVVDTKTSAQKLQEKMEQIIIPSIEFRQANINDVINFLVEASIQGDKDDQTGVNIILNLSGPGGDVGGQPASAPEPAFGGLDEGAGFNDLGDTPAVGMNASGSSLPTITLNLRRISLLDAIKYITEVARLKFRLEENAVIITPEGVVSGRVITRMYPVQPSIIDVVVDKNEAQDRTGEFVEMGSNKSAIRKTDVKDFFEKTGVPFPQGTSITYNPTISQLIVANTPENLEVFERILSRLNVIPYQVEIEARFVEITQDDLEELGFQWILTDNWEIAQKQGVGGVAGQQALIANADSDGFTKGLRFFNQIGSSGSTEPISTALATDGQTPLGGILSFASVLTNPEVKVIIQALSQHGGTDLLSAPRVTTRSGVNAQIQVVREIIYPTEFEVSEPTIAASTVSTGTGASGGLVTPPTVTPGSFETRETGVILNVTPTVGPDGYTIDLTMVPEVAELVDWIQYGSTVSAGGQTFQYNIPQPVFASRNVTTSIVIWDGQTVVMGGLIREDLVKVKDKVPLLGDIPLLGRLFRSEGEYSQKKNLLIFVTARLVDPAGKPIHRNDPTTVSDAATAADASAAKP
jgi:general secretion pathway protein D